MSIQILGIDLAKNVFSLHGTDAQGKPLLRKTVKRAKLLTEIANIPPCLIGMEACSGAHYWAREFTKLGHNVRIMAAKFVAPYRQNEKNDANDAEAICEAVSRPKTRFVAIKSEEQQAVLCLHRLRSGLVKDRTARLNRIRGLLQEFGIAIPQGRYPGQSTIQALLAEDDARLPLLARELLTESWQSILQLNQEILAFDRKLYHLARNSEPAKRIMAISGVGETTATAILATISDGKQFDNARQFSAWLGLTPKQNTTGGKIRLGGISKRGDKYLRTLLIHGARSAIANCKNKQDKISLWVRELVERRGFARACVALAAKNARLIWVLLTTGKEFQMNYQPS